MRLKPLATVFTLSILPLTAYAGDKETTFKITLNDKVVGHTSFALKPAGDKFHLNSRGDYTVPASGDDPAVNGDYKRTATLSSSYDLIQDASTNEVGTSRLTVYIAPSGGKLAIGAGGQGGSSSSNVQLDLHPNTVVVPNFDAGAVEALIRMHAKLPADAKMWGVIPSAAVELPVEISDAGSSAGTLAGAAVPVTHYTIKFPKLTIEAYTDASLNLMRADFPAQHASFTREGFQMSAVAK
jgi:hypothetical protein